MLFERARDGDAIGGADGVVRVRDGEPGCARLLPLPLPLLPLLLLLPPLLLLLPPLRAALALRGALGTAAGRE